MSLILTQVEYLIKFEEMRNDDPRTPLISRSPQNRLIYSISRIEGKIKLEQVNLLYMDKNLGIRAIALLENLGILKQIDDDTFEYIPYQPTVEELK